MPLVLLGLLPVGPDVLAVVELLGLLGRDGADLVVAAAVLARRVDDGVDVQLRGRRLARQLAQPLDQLLLQVVVDVVLLAEEDDAPL